MAVDIIRSVSADFASTDNPKLNQLAIELLSQGLNANLTGPCIGRKGDTITLTWDVDPTPELATIDAVIAAHKPLSLPKFNYSLLVTPHIIGAYTAGKFGPEILLIRNGYLLCVGMYRGTAGDSGQTVLDVKIDGVSVYADPSDRLTLAHDDGDRVSQDLLFIPFSQGGLMTFELAEVDSGSPSDLHITLCGLV